MTSSRTITLDQATAGDTLATELRDRHGNVLLPAGAVLNTAMIASLGRHQIEQVAVLETASEPEGAARDAALQLALQLKRVDALFGTHENEILNQKFKQYLVQFLSAQQS